MIWMLLLLGTTPAELDEGVKKADALAARAGTIPADKQPDEHRKAVDSALRAYDALIAKKPKDRRFVPRVRRRKATLLKREKRLSEALAEYEAIVSGRARRRDKARANYEAARLLPPKLACKRLAAVMSGYPDLTSVVAQAGVLRGRLLEGLQLLVDAERAYRFVIDRCADEPKYAIDAYDRLALLCIACGDSVHARTWLRACVRRYVKRASRGDRYGAYLSRLLGDMRAPRALNEAAAGRR